MSPALNFLPGEFWIERGRGRDYRELERFHYLPKRPATWCAVWIVRYRAPCAPPRIVALAVLSYPTRCSAPRRRALHLPGRMGPQLRFVNRHVRTISRVIVHPQFRALGLSSALVRCVCAHCKTRYCEAMAVMGRAHPFFERAGMKRYEPVVPEGAVYFMYERRTGRRGSRIHTNRTNLHE